MATPSFDDFYFSARRNVPGLSLERVREIYKDRYDKDPIFTRGPDIETWRRSAESQGIDLETADAEYERRYNTLPWYTDVARGVKRGLGNIAGTVGGVSHALGAEGFGQSAMDYAQGVQQRNAAEANLAQELLPEGGGVNWDLLSRPSWWAQGVGEVGTSMAPSIAAALATGGAGAPLLAQSLVGGAVGGLQEGFGGTYASQLREGVDQNTALMQSLGMAGGTMGLNAIGLRGILDKAPGLARHFGAGLLEGTTELAEEPLEAVLTGRDPIEATRQGAAVFPLAGLTGGLMSGVLSSPSGQTQGERDRFKEDLQAARESAPPPRRTVIDLPVTMAAAGETSGENTKVTSSGTTIEVEPQIVELDDLISSTDPRYPAELQPRDRDRDASVLQIREIATKLDPGRLTHQPEAGFGSPVVDERGVVRDGNGRTEALRLAYEQIPENAERYKQHLADQGHNLEGFQKPVLVDVAKNVPENYEIEANQADTLVMGAAETARADAGLVDSQLLTMYQGGDLDLAKNTDFVRNFINRMPAAQRNNMADERGRLSQAGINRIQGALLTYAYGQDGNLPGISRMLESADDNTRSITGGLIDAAPYMSELRTRIGEGQVAPEYDIGTALAEAAQKVSDARRNKQAMSEVLKQEDAFNPLTPLQRSAIEFFSRIRSRTKLATALQEYADAAMREGDTRQQGLLGEQKVRPELLLDDKLRLKIAARRTPENEINMGRFVSALDEAIKPTQRKVSAVKDWLKPLTANWGTNAPRVHVIGRPEDFPRHIQDSLNAEFGAGAFQKADGVRDGDNIYVVADKVKSRKDLARIVSHEAVGHYGLENILGPERWTQVKRQTLDLVLKDPEVKKAYETVKKRYGNAEGQVDGNVLASEIIAHLAESGVEHPLVRRILAYIREFLRQMGFDQAFKGLKFSRNDLQSLLAQAARYNERSDVGLIGGPATVMPRIMKVTTPKTGAYGGRKVDVVKNPTPQELKRFTANVNEGLRWFRDDNGDEYYWDAVDAVHLDIVEGLAKAHKIQTDLDKAYRSMVDRVEGEEVMPFGQRSMTGYVSKDDIDYNLVTGGLVPNRFGNTNAPYAKPRTDEWPFMANAPQPSLMSRRTFLKGLGGLALNLKLPGIHDFVDSFEDVVKKVPYWNLDPDAQYWLDKDIDDFRDLVRQAEGYLQKGMVEEAKRWTTLAAKDAKQLASYWMDAARAGTIAVSNEGIKKSIEDLNRTIEQEIGPQEPSLLEKTKALAREAHEGQLDYDGMPYFPHVQRVGNSGRNEAEKLVGYLHDIVEDTEVTIEDLQNKYPKEVIDAIEALSWREDQGESYDAYIERVMQNPLATAVKFFDTRDNMRLSGLDQTTGKPVPGAPMMERRTYDTMVKTWEAMEGEKPPLPGPEVMGQQGYTDGVMRNLFGMSRTASGMGTDAAGDARKAAKLAPGSKEEKAKWKRENAQNAWVLASQTNPQDLKTPEQLSAFIWDIARIMNHKIIPAGENLIRESESPFYMPSSEIGVSMREFLRRLNYMLTTTDKNGNLANDPVVTAAYIHRRFNHEIHPFADGVGGTTEILADWALAHSGEMLPVMPDRKEFYQKVTETKGDYVAWNDYYRSLFPQVPKVSRKLRAANQDLDVSVYGEYAADYRALLDEPHINDIPLELSTYSKILNDPAQVREQLEMARYVLDTPHHEIAKAYGGIDESWTLEDTRGGKVMNVDAFRELSDNYRSNRNLSFGNHEPASAWIKFRTNELLQIPANPNEIDEAVFMAGGSGAGKTTSLKELLKLFNGTAPKVIIDATMAGYDSALKKVNEARTFGNGVTYMYVYRDPVNAWLGDPGIPKSGGVYKRAAAPGVEGGGRPVDKDVHINNTIKARETAEKIIGQFAGDPRFQGVIVDNNFGYGNQKMVNTFAELTPLPARDTIEMQIQAGSQVYNEQGIPHVENGRETRIEVPPGVAEALFGSVAGSVPQGGSAQRPLAQTAQASFAAENLDESLKYLRRNEGEWLPNEFIEAAGGPEIVDRILIGAPRIAFTGKGAAGLGGWYESITNDMTPRQLEAVVAITHHINSGKGQTNGWPRRSSFRDRSLQGLYQYANNKRQMVQPSMAAENLEPEQPPPGPPDRGRLEAGGGSYSSRQWATLNDQEYETLTQVFDMSGDQVAAQRGGEQPKTWNETEAEAIELIVKDPQAVTTGLVRRKVGDTANAAQLEAYGMLLNRTVEDVAQAAERASQTNNDEDLAVFLSHFEKMAALQAPYAGYMTEAGRALNVLAKAKQAADSAAELIENAPDGLMERLKGSAVSSKRDRLQALANDIANSTPAETTSKARKIHKPDMFDKVYEYWVNAILSGPDTHMVNNASNALFQVVEGLAQVTGAMLPGGAPMRSVLARVNGNLHGVKLGAKAFRDAFVTGIPQMGQEQKFIEAEHMKSIGGTGGELVRVPGRALLAEDEFWKSIAYYGHASELAMMKAMEMGGNTRQNFADIMGSLEEHKDIVEKAQAEAHRLTFTTKMGPALSALNRGLIKSRLGKFIAPFIRTPSNILKEAVRYTPGAGAMIQGVRDDLAGKNGKDAKAAQYGRWIVGSGLYMMAGVLASAGDMSGAGPDDRNERKLLQRTGWQPYSVKIGDEWIKYNRLEPVGMVLGLAADGLEISQYAKGGELDKLTSLVMGSLMNNLADKTFLSGVFDFAEAASDPQRYGQRWVNRQVSSFIPNVVAQPTWKADPMVREANTLVERIRSRIPGKRQELRPIQDIAGQPIEQTSSSIPGNFLRRSPEQSDPLAETMLTLGLFRGKPGRTVQNTKLEDEEYADYSRHMQGARWRVLTPYVQSPQFRQVMAANPELARALLDKIWTKIGSEARIAWLYQNPEVLERGRQAKARPRAIGSRFIETQ